MFKCFLVTIMMVGLLTQSAYANDRTCAIAKHMSALKKIVVGKKQANDFLFQLSGSYSAFLLMLTAFGLFGDNSTMSWVDLNQARFFVKLFAVSAIIAVYNNEKSKQAIKEIKVLTAIEDELSTYIYRA